MPSARTSRTAPGWTPSSARRPARPGAPPRPSTMPSRARPRSAASWTTWTWPARSGSWSRRARGTSPGTRSWSTRAGTCEPRRRSVTGRVALVTGAGRGIGRSTALVLAARGARVMAVSRTERELAVLAREAGVEYLTASVASGETCDEIVAETARRLGPVDILVLNAGIDTGREEPVWAQ